MDIACFGTFFKSLCTVRIIQFINPACDLFLQEYSLEYCSTYSEALRIVEVLNSIAASNVSYQVEEVAKIGK